MTAKGDGGHAANPSKHSSIGVLSEAICRLENAPMRKRLLPCVERFLKESSPSLTFFQKFCLANNHILRPFLYLSFRNDKRIAPLFRTTFVPTQAKGAEVSNMLPEEAYAIINVRILHGDNIKKVLYHMRAMLSDLPVEISALGDGAPSKISDTNTESYELIRKTRSEERRVGKE